MPNEPPTNWTVATEALLASLVCPACSAANRPGVFYITVEQDGTYLCAVCGKSWKVNGTLKDR